MSARRVSYSCRYFSGESNANVRSSSPYPASCHPNHSGPTSFRGELPAMTTQDRTRSGSSAAHASADDPPPDHPTTWNVAMPRWSASAAVLRASCATARPGLRVDPPYPPRE